MMNYDFTEQVRRGLAAAREEAVRFQHDYVGPEHLLLGLLREGGPEVAEVLGGSGVDVAGLAAAVAARIRPGNARVTAGELPYTSRAKRVLELAMEAADRRHGRAPRGRRRSLAVGPAELLAAVLLEERSVAAVELRKAGLTEADLGLEGESEGPRRGEELPVVLDDASDRSIYEQIVQQIQERVAVGALEPGDRLPTVRRLADRLDIAPGTVSRAYGELERRGLVVTQRGRGTRVAKRERAAVQDGERAETLVGLLRPVAVAAFHMGATAGEVRHALARAMADIYTSGDEAAP